MGKSRKVTASEDRTSKVEGMQRAKIKVPPGDALGRLALCHGDGHKRRVLREEGLHDAALGDARGPQGADVRLLGVGK